MVDKTVVFIATALTRIMIAIYIIYCHVIAMPALWAISLKIDYINHERWPYKVMWKRFWEPL